MEPILLVLAGLVFVAAALYAYGGASGYLAAMALVGVAPEAMRPAALALNVLVAGIGTVAFVRAGRFSWDRLWPFALLSVLAAFVGGTIVPPPGLYRPVVGAVLLYSAFRLARQSHATGARGAGGTGVRRSAWSAWAVASSSAHSWCWRGGPTCGRRQASRRR